MIGRLSGTLLEKNPPQLLIECNGVGYEVSVPMSTFYNLPGLGEKVVLLTHFVVREDAQLLYGFGNAPEREVFRQLIRIAGVGARTALSILSGLSVAELASAITMQESGRLTKIPGIGKKTAERIVVELRDRAADLAGAGATLGMNAGLPADPQTEAVVALQQLGYKPAEAARMAKDAMQPGDDTATIIRKALQSALR